MPLISILCILAVANLSMLFTMKELGVRQIRVGHVLKVWGLGTLFCLFPLGLQVYLNSLN